jgi:hypothetical protein
MWEFLRITWGGLGFGENVEINFLGRAAREKCSVKWILVAK